MQVKLRLLIMLLFIFCSNIFLHAQKLYYNQQENFLRANSVWAFGDSAGLEFNNGKSIAIKTSYHSLSFNEGGASVADPVTGELYFYYDGTNLYNRNNQVTPNGKSIIGNFNTTQGSCIVPVIDSPGKYYLFSLFGATSHTANTASHGFLLYSIIDIKLNNGMGDVNTGKMNIVLDRDTLSESMIAVPGSNCDIWLLVHTYTRSTVGVNAFKAYHITRQGIDTVPVISNVPGPAGGGVFWPYRLGGMAVSPDRKMLVITSQFALFGGVSGTFLFKFNPGTGVVTDGLEVKEGIGAYTASFSPDNSKLYLINIAGSGTSPNQSLLQYDVSNYDSTAIANSETLISSISDISISHGYLRLYGDTIYCSLKESDSFLSTINQPNLAGLACDFQAKSIKLAAGTITKSSLPNEVVYPMAPDTNSSIVMDTTVCSGWEDGIVLYPVAISTEYIYQWDDGTTDSVREINTDGSYWVRYHDGCHYYIDSFKLKGSELNPVITINEFELGTTVSFITYQWMLNGNIIPGATDGIYAITENGNYRVIVSDGTCTDTSDVYVVTNYTQIDNINLTPGQVHIYPNPSNDIVYIQAPVGVNIKLLDATGKIILQVNDAHSISLKNLVSGLYLLQVSNRNGMLIKIEKIMKPE